MSDPGLVGVMGDLHGNTRWAVHEIQRICERLPDESPKIILQAGDFGVSRDTGHYTWAGKEMYRKPFLEEISDVLGENDAELWFCEGNHEDHDYLDEFRATVEMPWLRSQIKWLERGLRWEWHGRTWLACGGATSIDKLLRTEGVDWFPQEEITDEQEESISAGGPADVLLSHDAPSDCPLYLPPPESAAWLKMVPQCEDHRDRLQRICVAVKPSYVFHGHYHCSQDRTIHAVWGKCRFVTLGCDGQQGNWGILNASTMEWAW
jgi:Calcineurin-like phosphoesterase